MNKIETITMSMKEVDRLKIIQDIVAQRMKPHVAAQRLDITTRQVHRLVNRYLTEGAAGLISKKRGKHSNYQLAPGLANHALSLVREFYPDFGPTLACEKLSECHDLPAFLIQVDRDCRLIA